MSSSSSSLAVIVLRILFLGVSLFFLLSGILGVRHDVGNFYRGVIFLALPLIMDISEHIQKWIASKRNPAIQLVKTDIKKIVILLIMSGLAACLSLMLLLVSPNDVPVLAEHVLQNKNWEWSLVVMALFILPYFIYNCIIPVQKFIEGTQLTENRPDLQTDMKYMV